MSRCPCQGLLAIAAVALVAPPAWAQTTTTYHLHKEPSTTPGRLQLRIAGPDSGIVRIRTLNLKARPPLAATLLTFDTQAGVPGRGGVIPAHSTVTFTLWMRKTSTAGVVFPRATVGLNSPTTGALCTATGGTALTVLLLPWTLSCTTGGSAITMNTTDRLVVAAGFAMSAGPGNQDMRVVLAIEGTLNGPADSRVAVPNPVPPGITDLAPAAAPVGASITVTGTNFGPAQGASGITFNGTAASPTSWSDTRIVAPVPAGATSGPVVVSVGGASSNAVPFTVTFTGPLLEITSPASGTVVAPGESLMVTVTSPAGAPFAAVGLIGQSPLGTFDLGTALPASVTIPIPADVACRKYALTASGRTVSGQEASASISIDVEHPDLPIEIAAAPPQVRFEAPGPDFPLRILARFSDLSLLEVTESTRVGYSSSDPGVAVVDSNGMVTAVAPGSAMVTARYELPPDGLETRIPVAVPAPVFTMSPASLDFGERAVGTTSSLQMTLTNTSRAPLGITSVAATGDFASADDCVSASPLPVGGACTITVTFGPTATGLRASTLVVANSFYTIPVAFGLTGTGVSP